MKVDLGTAITVGFAALAAVVAGIVLVGGVLGWLAHRRRRKLAIADAKADARCWYEMLVSELGELSGRGDSVAEQALEQAEQRRAAAASRFGSAKNAKQFRLVRHISIVGLRHVGDARRALGLSPGPQGPPPLRSDGPSVYRAGAVLWYPSDEPRRRTSRST